LIYKCFLSKIKRCLIKNIHINQIYDNNKPGIAGSDRDRLIQVMLNLLSDAVKLLPRRVGFGAR
jgi:nitrogen-specific signal transduction histidine kinase